MQLSGILNPAQVLFPKTVFFATMVGAGAGEARNFRISLRYAVFKVKGSSISHFVKGGGRGETL